MTANTGSRLATRVARVRLQAEQRIERIKNIAEQKRVHVEAAAKRRAEIAERKRLAAEQARQKIAERGQRRLARREADIRRRARIAEQALYREAVMEAWHRNVPAEEIATTFGLTLQQVAIFVSHNAPLQARKEREKEATRRTRRTAAAVLQARVEQFNRRTATLQARAERKNGIAEMYAAGIPASEIGKRFNVSATYVCYVADKADVREVGNQKRLEAQRARTTERLAGIKEARHVAGKREARRKAQEQRNRAIVAMLDGGFSFDAVVARFGLSLCQVKQTVRAIRAGFANYGVYTKARRAAKEAQREAAKPQSSLDRIARRFVADMRARQ